MTAGIVAISRRTSFSGSSSSRVSDLFGPSNPVIDAFTIRRWLVTLHYAQRKFVVAVKNTEAEDEGDACRVAARRARASVKGIGNLIRCECTDDSEKNRVDAGVASEEPRRSWSTKWVDAA